MSLHEKLGLYFIADAGCPKGSNTSKSLSSMNALIKECERQIVHPSATQALYMGVWGRTRVEKTAVLLLSGVASTKPLVRSPVLGLPG